MGEDIVHAVYMTPPPPKDLNLIFDEKSKGKALLTFCAGYYFVVGVSSLCIVGCLAASLASTLRYQLFAVVTTKNTSNHSQLFLRGSRLKLSLVENHCDRTMSRK